MSAAPALLGVLAVAVGVPAATVGLFDAAKLLARAALERLAHGKALEVDLERLAHTHECDRVVRAPRWPAPVAAEDPDLPGLTGQFPAVRSAHAADDP